MTAGGRRRAFALALQVAALAALALALLGVSWLDARTHARLLVLVDRSLSMPRPATDAALAEVVGAARAAGSDAEILEFAGMPAPPSAQADDAVARLQPTATHVERALDAALEAHAAHAYAGAVVISDGFANAGDTERGLRAARAARLPVQWIAVGRPPPATRIVDLLAPDRATAGQPIPVTVQLAGRLDAPLRVTATARSPKGETQRAGGAPDREGRVTLELSARGTGAMLVDLVLESAERRLDARHDAVAIDVVARAPILYLQGSAGALSRSLRDGGWALDVIAATRADAHADRLEGYEAVVLDDVAIADAGERFWSALAAAVRHRGLGLLVLGGERSFSRGGYRESVLESILPVTSEPAALDQPASVVFVVDKSGSMGQGTGGVDRFRLAQRAVLETARGLSERDSLGLVVFDVEPRVLVPLGPVRAGTAALERPWPVSPRGGTRLAPALEVAIGELERANTARRILVVVTDGFATDTALPQVGARLAQSKIETIALAVGADADLAALGRLLPPDSGALLRVNEAAELPVVMRSGLERRRARVERGTLAVEQRAPLPFAGGTLKDWPPVAAYAVTRARSEAAVAVRSERGDPLVAYQTSGQGRIVVVTCGLGRWTPRWMPWPEWPRLAGGLLDWIGGASNDATLGLAVSSVAGGVRVDADIREASRWAPSEGVSLTVTSPAAETRPLHVEPVAPGRLHAEFGDAGPGLYTVVLSTPHGTQRRLHLRRARAEDDDWGTNPAIDAWRDAGLVANWRADAVARRQDATSPGRRTDRWLVGLSLALFLAGVVVDRYERVRNLLRRRRDLAQGRGERGGGRAGSDVSV